GGGPAAVSKHEVCGASVCLLGTAQRMPAEEGWADGRRSHRARKSMRVTAAVERFPIRESFVISRGAKTEAAVVVAAVEDGGFRGRGEAVPYARYGESLGGTMAQIES